MFELKEDDSLLRACDAFRLPLSHPGFNPLSQNLWQPFVQGHLNFPEKSGDLSGGIRTRLVPSPICGCALWLVCLSPLPPHSCEWACVWIWKDGESESEGMLGGVDRVSKDAESSVPFVPCPLSNCQSKQMIYWLCHSCPFSVGFLASGRRV